jgi:hypothetical protein
LRGSSREITYRCRRAAKGFHGKDSAEAAGENATTFDIKRIQMAKAGGKQYIESDTFSIVFLKPAQRANSP